MIHFIFYIGIEQLHFPILFSFCNSHISSLFKVFGYTKSVATSYLPLGYVLQTLEEGCLFEKFKKLIRFLLLNILVIILLLLTLISLY
ncbi:hypothetical protein FC695_35020 [Bacillus cereus]|uniref:Uncharacterized protein n=1 Tax=Bacillus cereus TaxID=1396 RepID=A0A9X8ZRD0_BACCE|nr:hypothetical protein FC692_17710 [Bacillus cereus]TKI90033.1 hypothetical protein FC695_35020 [Bacillus cereus]